MTGRERNLWVCYRLTVPEYDAILDFQGRVCAGCSRPPGGTRLAVDHCHKTGRIRGLLCWLCNRSIGLIRDRAKTALNLGKYLGNPTAPQALGHETFGLIGRAKASKKVKVYGDPLLYAAFIKAVE
jgi:Recombination endonuclease VII